MKKEINENLIEKALHGDMELFSAIYFALRGSIYGFVFRMVRENSLAEDITQDTFIFLLENTEKFDAQRGSLLSFLCGVARHKVMRYFRKHSTRSEYHEEDLNSFETAENSDLNQLEGLLKKELTQKIEEEILKLPVLYREVLILREMEELSYAEIASITNTDLNQVKIRLYRARKKIAEELKPYFVEAKEKKIYEMC